MREEFARAILRAAREVGECLVSGEHPAAALSAVRTAYSWCHTTTEDLFLLADLVGACEKAVKFYPVSAEDVRERVLPGVVRRMRGLVARAEEAVRCEECFA